MLPSRTPEFVRAFSNLRELQISATLVTWYDTRLLTSYMPHLRLLEAGYNHLSQLALEGTNTDRDLTVPDELAVINLDGNELTGWTHTCEALRPFAGYVIIIDLAHSSGHLRLLTGR